jgi:hypothetical protein
MNKQLDSKETIFLVSDGCHDKHAFKSERDAYTYACWCIDESLRIFIKPDDDTVDIFDDSGCFFRWDYRQKSTDADELSKKVNTICQWAKIKGNCFLKYDCYDDACDEHYTCNPSYDDADEDEDEYIPLKDRICWPEIEEIKLVSVLGRKKISLAPTGALFTRTVGSHVL